MTNPDQDQDEWLDDLHFKYLDWPTEKAEILARQQAAIDKAVAAVKREPIGDAIEIDVPLETMQFVLSKVKIKPKTIADRLLMQEWQVNNWLDGTADKYDLNIYIWRLKILAHLSHRYNWAIFLLKPENLPVKAALTTPKEKDMESTCQDCRGHNPVWFAPNELWNKVVDDKTEIICPVCFTKRAEAKGIKPSAWTLTQESASKERKK